MQFSILNKPGNSIEFEYALCFLITNSDYGTIEQIL